MSKRWQVWHFSSCGSTHTHGLVDEFHSETEARRAIEGYEEQDPTDRDSGRSTADHVDYAVRAPGAPLCSVSSVLACHCRDCAAASASSGEPPGVPGEVYKGRRGRRSALAP